MRAWSILLQHETVSNELAKGNVDWYSTTHEVVWASRATEHV